MANLLRSSLFKLPKHRRFDYQPIYYDAAQEAKEKQVKLAQAQREIDFSEKPIQFQKGSFYRNRSRSRVVGLFADRGQEDAVVHSYTEYDRLVNMALIVIVLSLPFILFLDMLQTNIVVFIGIITTIYAALRWKRLLK